MAGYISDWQRGLERRFKGVSATKRTRVWLVSNVRQGPYVYRVPALDNLTRCKTRRRSYGVHLARRGLDFGFDLFRVLYEISGDPLDLQTCTRIKKVIVGQIPKFHW